MAITEAMIRQYQHPRIKLTVGALTLYEDDLISGSFSYKAGTSGGGAFAPGGCVIASCSFSVYNRDGSLTNTFQEDTEVGVYIGYGATAEGATYDKLCTVYVATVKRRNYRLAIQCFDKLRKADKKKWTQVTFPTTVSAIIQSAATQAQISVAQLPTAGGTITVDLRDSEGNQPSLGITCRQALSEALLISGNFGYINADGQLYCGWYNSSADDEIDADWLFDFSSEDAQTYTGVQVYGQVPSGSTSRLYVLSGGTFLNEVNASAVQTRLRDALVGVQVMPAEITAVCNPNIHPGMTVDVPHPEAGVWRTDTILIMNTSISGGFLAQYSSETISADEADDLRKSKEKATENVASGEYPTKAEMEEAIEEAISGGGGVTVVHFPEVKMKCNDSTHWYAVEAPCNQYSGDDGGITSYIRIGYNSSTQKSEVSARYSNEGYDFRTIIWYSGDVAIPSYDPDKPDNEFDVTMYLYEMILSQGEAPRFEAYKSESNQLYLLPLHARAKYSGGAHLIFTQQWLWMPANYTPNTIVSGLRIPLPSRRFNIETSQWELPTPQSAVFETYYAPVEYLT